MRYAGTEKYNPLTKQPKKIPVDLWDETLFKLKTSDVRGAIGSIASNSDGSQIVLSSNDGSSMRLLDVKPDGALSKSMLDFQLDNVEKFGNFLNFVNNHELKLVRCVLFTKARGTPPIFILVVITEQGDPQNVGTTGKLFANDGTFAGASISKQQ